MKLIDSHCHIHDEDFPVNQEDVFQNAKENNITKMICVGVSTKNSQEAINFCKINSSKEIKLFATCGVHPHEADKLNSDEFEKIIINNLNKGILVAIGEIGLDFHYNNSSKSAQIKALETQLNFAQKYDLPVSFHVRDAYDEFWPIFEKFNKAKRIKGVLHSFTDTLESLEKAIKYGLFIGTNGISTFVKKPDELEMFNSIPLEKMILETDAPFLAPKGKRGKANQPANILDIAKDIAIKREMNLEEIASITSKNSEDLFGI